MSCVGITGIQIAYLGIVSRYWIEGRRRSRDYLAFVVHVNRVTRFVRNCLIVIYLQHVY